MEEKELEKRKNELKDKIKSFLNNTDNVYLIAVLLFAFLIRMYYFFLTSHQALWWDEAEYMLKVKSIFFDIPVTGLAEIREPVIPYIWSLFYLLGGEIGVRFFQIIMSLFTVFMTYVVGRQLFNRKIGILSALFMSVLSIPLFFTNRLLTYPWTSLIYLIVISLFLIGIKNKNKYLYLSSAFLAIGLIAYFNTLFLIILFFLFLIFTERFKLFKEKRFIISAIIFILVLAPFIIYYFITLGVPLPRFSQFQIVSQGAVSGEYLPFSQWFGYIHQIPRILGHPSYFGLPLIFFAFLGILSLIEVVLGFDLILKSKSEDLKNKFLLWLWILVPLFLLTIIEIVQKSTVFYDAFLHPIFPALSIISAIGVISFFNFANKHTQKFSKIIIIILILFVIISNLSYANSMITNKMHSYDTLIDAGLWIKQNSNTYDKVLTQAIPEITYYSERESLSIPREEVNLSVLINEEKPKFFVLTAWEAAASPRWSLDYAQKNPGKFIPIIAFPINSQQPTTIVFVINLSAFEQE